MARSSVQTNADLSIRRALLRLQRGVQRRLQAEVRSYTGGHTPALERYYREYMKEFHRFHSVASYGELFEQLLSADILYIGDYHTLRQSQEVAMRILERAATDERPTVLALEMVAEEHQEFVDAYTRGELADADFLARVEYRRTWNFNWSNYKPLFEMARELGVRIVGINHESSSRRGRFQKRDSRIAKTLVDTLLQQPATRVLVLIGDLHLASNHLPRCVDEELQSRGEKRQRLIIHQNSDTLYWNLAEKGRAARTQVVRLGQDRYCVMEVPPFVKLQSYLSWEQTADRLEIEPVEDASAPTVQNVVNALIRQLANFIGVAAPEEDCDVFINLDEAFFEALEGCTRLSQSQVRHFESVAFANRSCYVPEIHSVYLPFFSVNHAAEEAMHVLQYHMSGPTGHENSAFERFYADTLGYAFGFMASKLVNPRRLATSEDEFAAFLTRASRQLGDPQLDFRKQVARLVLQHKNHERSRMLGGRGRLKQIYQQPDDIRLEIVLALGYILGDRLYEHVMEGAIQREQLRGMLLVGYQQPSELYFDVLQLCH